MCLAPIEVRGPNTQSRVSEGSQCNKGEYHELTINALGSESRLLSHRGC